MQKHNKKTSFVLILFAIVFLAGFVCLSRKTAAQAASPQPITITADYEKKLPVSTLEVRLSVESSSKLTMLKYAYARISKGVYFTKYAQNGTTIQQASDGTYSFSVTQNGYVSVFAMNEDGEEALFVFKVSNVDTKKPTLTLESEQRNTLYLVSLTAEDDTSDVVTIQYVKGAYASGEDPVWQAADTATFTDFCSVILEEGKYTFKATDEAGNSHIIIRRFGQSKEVMEEFRAVWISYLEFKSSGYTETEFREQIEKMFNEVCAMNMNAVVVHVRPFGDAMYPSEYFPWSRYVSGTQGKTPGFDPLEIMIEEAHARGLQFHAWINPYRVTSGSTEITALSKDNPARIYRTDAKKSNDRNVLAYGGNLYYNPASAEVQTLIVNGIKEIVQNYNVDGIHFDDYFYPTLGKNFTSNFDAAEYNSYKESQIAQNNTYLSIADWRRENVNTLVRTVYAAIKELNSEVVFGISPGGFMDALKADDRYYVDFETWLGYDGYIDYLCPQLYWSNAHTIYPYNEILNRFIEAAINPDVKLYVGIAAYKAGIKTEEAEWYQNPNVLRNMITYARATNEIDGFILYRYNYLISKRNYVTLQNMMKEFD